MHEKAVRFHFYDTNAGQFMPLGMRMFSDMRVYERERGSYSVLQDHPPHPDGKLLV